MKFASLSLLLGLLPALSSGEILLLKNGVLVDRALVKKNSEKTSGSPLKSDPAGDDVVLFDNGDVMHGSFAGIDGGLLWGRKDIERNIRFSLPSVRQVVRSGGQTTPLHRNSSFFTLVSGDRIPGELVSLDEQSLVIKSTILGDLTIPRAHLESITPNPFDGELYYTGPHTSDGWVILGPKSTPVEEKLEKKIDEAEKSEEAEDNSPWIHSGASFYNLGSAPLAFPEADLPEVGRIGFRIEWKGRLNLTLALLSDFTRPVPVAGNNEKAEEEPPAALKDEDDENGDEEDENKEPEFRSERLVDLRKGNQFQTIPWLESGQSSTALKFGSGYSLTLYSSYPYLTRNSFNGEGEPVSSRMSTGRSSISLSEQGDAEIEIRYDRNKALIMLYIDGEYAAQWNDLGGVPGEGTGFGLLNTSPSARVKISEMAITAWNGMKDNAKSMTHPERDVALLVNGTDRFSGKLSKISDGTAYLKSPYLDAEIPLADISRIILSPTDATKIDELPEDLVWESDPLTVLYRPFGLVKLIPSSSDGTIISGRSPFLGEIKLDLTSASLLRFSEGSPDLSDWFDDL